MHLRNPGTIDAAIQTLRQLQSTCENCRSAYTSFDAAKNAYLSWVDTAYGQLLDLFVDGDLADGLHSRLFSEILRLDRTSPRPWELLNRELRIQSERLQAAIGKLLDYKAFASRDGHIVVPDTSALVQGVWLEDFDWPTELGLTPPVRIVIPILVVEELDKLKDSERTTKAGDRARRVLKRLRELCGAVPPGHPAQLPTRTNVTVEVLLDDDWHERRPNNDGEIIDQALLVKALTGQDVRLVCVDAAMQFRTRQHGLTVFAMPTPADVGHAAAKQRPRPDDGLSDSRDTHETCGEVRRASMAPTGCPHLPGVRCRATRFDLEAPCLIGLLVAAGLPQPGDQRVGGALAAGDTDRAGS